MATVSAAPLSDAALPSGSTMLKRTLEVPSRGDTDASEARQLKRQRVELEQASFPRATLLDTRDFGSESAAGDAVYVRGEVVQVLNWKKDTQTASLSLRLLDSELAYPVRCVLRGAWAEGRELPKVSSTAAVLLREAEWERQQEVEAEEPAQVRWKIVFNNGALIKWGTRTLDGFKRSPLVSPSAGQQGLSRSSSLADVEDLTTAGPSLSSRALSPLPPHVQTAIASSITSTSPPKINRSSSSVATLAGTSKRPVSVTDSESRPAKRTSTSPATSPQTTAVPAPAVKREALSQSIGQTAHIDVAVKQEQVEARVVHPPAITAPASALVDTPTCRSPVEPSPIAKSRLSHTSQTGSIAARPMSDARIPSPPAGIVPTTPALPLAAPSTASSTSASASQQTDDPSSGQTTSTDGSAEASTSSAGSKKDRRRVRKDAAAALRKQANGGDGNSAESAPKPKGVLSAKDKQEKAEIEQGKFDLGLKAGLHSYLGVSETRAIGPSPPMRAVMGVVTDITPVKQAKNGQSYISFRIEDPSGHISVRLFYPTRSYLPPDGTFQVGCVAIVRGVKIKMALGELELLGSSFDGFAWAFADSTLTTYVHQEPLRPATRDLESLAALGPTVEAYLRKIAAWSQFKFNFVKDDSTDVVRFADATVAPKPKGRRTLRLEEVKNEREFFDLVAQVVKIEKTDMGAMDVWVTDWTRNDLFADHGPSTSYDGTPTEPFGTYCFKIGIFESNEDVSSQLKVGRPFRFRNVKPRIREFWEGSMMDPQGCRYHRLESCPEQDELTDRRGVFMTDLRERTRDAPLPNLAKDVKVAGPSASGGRPTLMVSQLEDHLFCNLVCQVVSVQYLNSATSTVVEVTDFSENRSISVSVRPAPKSNPPTHTFGRYVLQVTFWDDAGRGDLLKNLATGSLIHIQNVKARLLNGTLSGHVNPPKMAGSKVPAITMLRRTDPSVAKLLEASFFSSAEDENGDAARPRVSSDPSPARELEPDAEVAAAPVALGRSISPSSLAEEDVPTPTGVLGAVKLGDRLDCIVQVVSVRGGSSGTVTLLVTDFSANPAIPPARLTRAPDDSVFPHEAFGRCVWTIWVSPSVGLTSEFLAELNEGKLLHLRGLDITEMPGEKKGLMGRMNRREREGARVSVTRMSEGDERAKKVLRQRHAYYNPPAKVAVARPPPPAQPVVKTPTDAHYLASKIAVDEPLIKPAGPTAVQTAASAPPQNAVAGPSVPRPAPITARKSPPPAAAAPPSNFMVARPSATTSPTYVTLPTCPDERGCSLHHISSASDEGTFRTRARIVDYYPKDLTEIVISTCESCDTTLDPDATRCPKSTCPYRTEPIITHSYRLCLLLSDGTRPTPLPVLVHGNGDDLLALFPKLPADPKDFLEAPSGPVKHLRQQLTRLAPGLGKKGEGKEEAEEVWCDLAVRKDFEYVPTPVRDPYAVEDAEEEGLDEEEDASKVQWTKRAQYKLCRTRMVDE